MRPSRELLTSPYWEWLSLILMAQAKYTQAQAATIARAIADRLGPLIVIACVGTSVRPEWLAGLIGMENPQLREYPDTRSYRFEPGIYDKLRRLSNPLIFWRRCWSGITQAQVKGLSDAVLRELATSWGWTQIMGYSVLTVFKGLSIAQLRDKQAHLDLAVDFMRHVAGPYLDSGRFDQVCHIWNTGAPYKTANGRPVIRTYSPYYIYNCGLVALEFKALLPSIVLKQGQIVMSRGVPKALIAQDTPAVDARKAPTVKSGSLFVVDKTMNIIGQASREGDIGTLRPLAGPLSQGDTAVQTEDKLDPFTGQDTQALDELPQTEPADLPKIGVTPGWKTSQGQLTALFVAVAAILSLLGWHYTPEQLQSWWDAGAAILKTIGPLLTAVPILINYINSRGKIASNQVWATATMNNPLISNKNIDMQGLAAAGFDIGGIADIVRGVGQVAGGKTGKTIGSILGSGGSGGAGVSQKDFDAFRKEVLEGFEQIARSIQELETRLSKD